MSGEMVSIEFHEAVAVTGRAYDDALAVLLAFCHGVHGSPEGVNASYI